MEPSFESVFLPHYPRVFRVILRMVGNRETALELTQETYLKALRQHPMPNSNPSAWLCRIAMHLALDSLRREKRWWQRLPRLWGSSRTASFEQSLVDQDLGRTLAQALPEKERSILVLRSVGELSYQEIADILNLPTNQVGVYLQRARERALKTARKLGLEP